MNHPRMDFNQLSIRGVTTGFAGNPTVGIYIDDSPFGSTVEENRVLAPNSGATSECSLSYRRQSSRLDLAVCAQDAADSVTANVSIRR